MPGRHRWPVQRTRTLLPEQAVQPKMKATSDAIA